MPGLQLLDEQLDVGGDDLFGRLQFGGCGKRGDIAVVAAFRGVGGDVAAVVCDFCCDGFCWAWVNSPF